VRLHVPDTRMYSPGTYGRRRWRSKGRERNIIASLLSVVVIILLCTSLSQPRWFSLKGGGCDHSYIALYDFFYIGSFEYRSDIEKSTIDTIYHTMDETMNNCVTSQVVILLRLMIAFLLLATLASALAFCLDIIGSTHVVLRILRRNAVGSIHTVVFCVTVIGLSYLSATLMQQQQEATKQIRISKAEVKFDVGFYMVTAAGAVGILATAANLFRRYAHNADTSNHQLLEDFDGLETFSIGYPSRVEVSPIEIMPPPPPYTP